MVSLSQTNNQNQIMCRLKIRIPIEFHLNITDVLDLYKNNWIRKKSEVQAYVKVGLPSIEGNITLIRFYSNKII